MKEESVGRPFRKRELASRPPVVSVGTWLLEGRGPANCIPDFRESGIFESIFIYINTDTPGIDICQAVSNPGTDRRFPESQSLQAIGNRRRIRAVSPKAMVLLGLSVIAFLGVSGASGQDGSPVPRNVSPGDAFALIRENAENDDFVILDVRTPGEFAKGHLEGAVLNDYRSPAFREEVAHLDRGKTYLVYCRTANRSARAIGIMKDLGFRNILHLEGGIVRWSEEGLPVVRTAPGEETR